MNSEDALRKSRALWEDVFPHESGQFLDYYDRHVADHNRIYLEEEHAEAVSMLHCNPYLVHMREAEAEVSYLVAVGTKEPYRRQGRMRRLLYAALTDSRARREPFVYLTPASERIYLPFGFRTVGYQNVVTVGSVCGIDAGYRCRKAEPADFAGLADFAERTLPKYCAVYTRRDAAYFARMQKEQEAMNGGILLLYRQERPAGYCFYSIEEGTEIRELVADSLHGKAYAGALCAVTRYLKEALPLKLSGLLPGSEIEGISRREIAYRPMTMARITDLFSFVQKLYADTPVQAFLDVRDDFLPKNEGRFYLSVSNSGGTLERVSEQDAPKDAVLSVTIEELTDCFFGVRSLAGLSASALRTLHPVYLNELV